jgi:catechol 2,3-dioxygenase
MNTSYAPFTVAPDDYQLPGDIVLGAVTLQVSSLERSLYYYTRVVGLRVLQRAGQVASLGIIGSDEVLVCLREKAGVHAVPPRGRLGLYHFAILLPSRAALGQFLAHLGEINEYAGMSDHLVSEALYLTDPDGLGIEVYADRPRAGWRVEGTALAMATDALNVADLLAAAGATPWVGMPPGTRIGHVHLYVDTLEKSAAFFHRSLGFDRVELQFPGALFLSAGGYHHHLGTNTWAARSPVATGDDARLLEWTMHFASVAEVRDVAQALDRAGFPPTWDDGAAVVTDPWGTRLRLSVV